MLARWTRHCTSLTSRSVKVRRRQSSESKIAVLIDGDNADPALVADVLAEAGRYGKVTVKRIYADWTLPSMRAWKEKLNSHAVRPIQKFAYTKAKNSTDTALIIDAMDMLHSRLVDGFCIVSSDSDYTGLAHRIREEGMFVMGIGKEHTPQAFIQSCATFTYTEIFKAKGPTTSFSSENSLRSQPPPKTVDIDLINRGFRIAVNIDSGLAALSRVAEELRKLDPTFDHRNYGFSSFKRFCDALGQGYELVLGRDGTTYFLREKPAQTADDGNSNGSGLCSNEENPELDCDDEAPSAVAGTSSAGVGEEKRLNLQTIGGDSGTVLYNDEKNL